MENQAAKFLNKYKIDIRKIMYLTRDGRKTVLHMANGGKYDTYLPLKEVLADLPEGMFECINKGIAVSSGYVTDIQENEFVMANGTRFKGRVRIRKSQKEIIGAYKENRRNNEWEDLGILNNLPFPFCVMELVFDENGRGIDFVLRYCNKEMELLGKRDIRNLVNRSLFEALDKENRKLLVAYADVALNGVERIVEGYGSDKESSMKLFCYQPKINYCACMMLPA